MKKNLVLLCAVFALALQWIIVSFSGLKLGHHEQALLAGIAIFASAFMLSWVAELAQMEMPQALAIAMVALLAVLPEYAVDLYFAWNAAQDPSYAQYAAANMTGANRLLVGVGWATIVIIFWWKRGAKSVTLENFRKTDIWCLLLATLYSFVIPFKGTLSLVDSVFFIAIFFYYIVSAFHSEMVEAEIDAGPPAWIKKLPRVWRITAIITMFVCSGATIYLAAEPFAEGLISSAKELGIEEFLLVQWLAPLASEAPEFIVALIFTLRVSAGAGIGTLISSEVNQWTLLIGTVPLAYAISGGNTNALPLDARQAGELFLTSAQSLYAIAIIANLSFSVVEASFLFLLFLIQFLITDSTMRYAYGFVYVCLTIILFILYPENKKMFFQMFRKKYRRPHK